MIQILIKIFKELHLLNASPKYPINFNGGCVKYTYFELLSIVN